MILRICWGVTVRRHQTRRFQLRYLQFFCASKKSVRAFCIPTQEAANVVTQGLVGLLTAPSEIPRIPRTHVHALEVAHEGLDQVGPVVDLIGGKLFEPCTHGICKVQRKVVNDHGIITRTAQLASQAVVVELETVIFLSRVFGEGGGLPKAWGKRSSVNFSAEHTGAQRLR